MQYQAVPPVAALSGPAVGWVFHKLACGLETPFLDRDAQRRTTAVPPVAWVRASNFQNFLPFTSVYHDWFVL